MSLNVKIIFLRLFLFRQKYVYFVIDLMNTSYF